MTQQSWRRQRGGGRPRVLQETGLLAPPPTTSLPAGPPENPPPRNRCAAGGGGTDTRRCPGLRCGDGAGGRHFTAAAAGSQPAAPATRQSLRGVRSDRDKGRPGGPARQAEAVLPDPAARALQGPGRPQPPPLPPAGSAWTWQQRGRTAQPRFSRAKCTARPGQRLLPGRLSLAPLLRPGPAAGAASSPGQSPPLQPVPLRSPPHSPCGHSVAPPPPPRQRNPRARQFRTRPAPCRRCAALRHTSRG